MTDQEARNLPISRRANEALKKLGAKISQPGFPPTDLLEWALENLEPEDRIRGSTAMMREHLWMLGGKGAAEAAALLLGEDLESDPGSDPDDVVDELLDRLHFRMTETVEGYPPVVRTL
jgi:hypothetical protein